MQNISIKPYLLRAHYEWCTDNGFTPHIAVKVDNRTRVPYQFVRNNEIVLNISFNATSQLQISNDLIEFLTRFSGKSYKIRVPISNILAIYARENSQGIAFERLTDETIDGASALISLIGNKFRDINSQEKRRMLNERAFQQPEISKLGVETQFNLPHYASEIQGKHIPDLDNVVAADNIQNSREHKHLKVIK
ncbi:ClpXP protease specificity-enhancing factor [Candidatus Vallotiella sp. (ex Adelges kitamiensis)]|uniref:ClpXP protease specificity-enhancing factor n=1 Tax=Candidatus Vallotiella sp. (ex Adelges kitamiensis) TaxID=2864217 RepID=UPI001CE31EE2|nr:ClpXP protease specificity-enhancing factor [Candidatus Vallotia sp. (ex Adelges kitamiensis)]